MSWSAASIRRAREDADRPWANAQHAHALAYVEAIEHDAAHGRALRKPTTHADWRAAETITGFEPDAALRAIAQRRADLMTREVERLFEVTDLEGLAAWIHTRTQMLAGYSFEFTDPPTQAEVSGALARIVCAMWWRRRLRRLCVQTRERIGQERGEVCNRARSPYCTTDTHARRREQNKRNRQMMEATELENEHGECFTLAALIDKSPSAKHIRRGELMTRIRGCEEWADAAGFVGIFTTNTAPSRFHPQSFHGGANPRADGSTPREAQAWLRATWARARAALQRAGVAVFGFRVAEPHHDGCPHWHMLLWCHPEQAEALRETLWRHWLSEELKRAAAERKAERGRWACMVCGKGRTQRVWGPLRLEHIEAGAAAHRFKAVAMVKGGAAGYVAKYIAKNVDDAGAIEREGHRDESDGAQVELFGGSATRVEAWAAAHGIRQFQAIGQPPVTVWRELRRLDAGEVAGSTLTMQQAFEASHRVDDKRADWRRYMQAQGGPMKGRAYVLRIATRDEERAGRYETINAARPVGVVHTDAPRYMGGERFVSSNRRQWRAKGTWSSDDLETVASYRTMRCYVYAAHLRPEVDFPIGRALEQPKARHVARIARPWTRFNNCTDAADQADARTYEWPVETGQPLAPDPGAAFWVKAEALRNLKWSYSDDPPHPV